MCRPKVIPCGEKLNEYSSRNFGCLRNATLGMTAKAAMSIEAKRPEKHSKTTPARCEPDVHS